MPISVNNSPRSRTPWPPGPAIDGEVLEVISSLLGNLGGFCFRGPDPSAPGPPFLFAELLRRGYSDDDVFKIAGTR